MKEKATDLQDVNTIRKEKEKLSQLAEAQGYGSKAHQVAIH